MMEKYTEIAGDYRGYKYEVVLTSAGHRCGYVHLHGGEFGLFDDIECEIDVHGGITYCYGDCIGFDCAHLGDAPDVDAVEARWGSDAVSGVYSCFRPEVDVVRTADFVERECRKVIDQLVEAAGPIVNKQQPNKGERIMLNVSVLSQCCPLQLELTVPSPDDCNKKLVVGYVRIRSDRVSAYGIPQMPAPLKDEHFDRAVKLFEGECHIPGHLVESAEDIVCQAALVTYCIGLVETWYNKVYLKPQDGDGE
jgi:hypothetical protein